jgi:membrane-anchored protein YejM (alkaline phosphatase superfamily)
MSKLEVEVPLAKSGEEKQPDSDAELSEDVLAYREKRYTTIKWLHFWAFVFFLVQTVIYSAIKPDIAVGNPTAGCCYVASYWHSMICCIASHHISLHRIVSYSY